METEKVTKHLSFKLDQAASRTNASTVTSSHMAAECRSESNRYIIITCLWPTGWTGSLQTSISEVGMWLQRGDRTRQTWFL